MSIDLVRAPGRVLGSGSRGSARRWMGYYGLLGIALASLGQRGGRGIQLIFGHGVQDIVLAWWRCG
jgi:hypothetical protein